MTACRSCHAPIEWATTHKGKKMPIEKAVFSKGNLVVSRDLLGELTVSYVTPGDGTHVSHFATCPYANEFRRKDGEK